MAWPLGSAYILVLNKVLVIDQSKGLKVETVFFLNREFWLLLNIAMNFVVGKAANPDAIRFNVLLPPREEQLFEKTKAALSSLTV